MAFLNLYYSLIFTWRPAFSHNSSIAGTGIKCSEKLTKSLWAKRKLGGFLTGLSGSSWPSIYMVGPKHVARFFSRCFEHPGSAVGFYYAKAKSKNRKWRVDTVN